MYPIEIASFSKIYNIAKGKKKTAVNNLSLEVPEGIIFGFLGPNGAGKTTTIKSILDFIQPSEGCINIYGIHSSEPKARTHIGYLPEQLYFHKFLKPIELVSLHARLAGYSKSESIRLADEAIEKAGIAEYRDIVISKLSKGLTQRVGLAQAIVGSPKLLILDEPTSGLDPIGRKHTRELLLSLKEEGATIFLSSHILSEIENVCDIVAVMKRGELQAVGNPEAIRSSVANIKIITKKLSTENIERLLFTNTNISSQSGVTEIITPASNLYTITSVLCSINAEIINIQTQRETLEEAFLRLAA